MDRAKALDLALANIEKQFGKGSLMRLGDEAAVKVAAIPTGALSLDLALGIGGLPRGRVVEIFGPESSGKCLPAGTYVWTDHGLETIEELFARVDQPVSCTSRVTDVRDYGVRLVNEDAGLEPMAGVTHNDRKPVWRIELESGRHVEATANHPLRVLDEHDRVVWRTVGALREGDVMVSALFGADISTGGSDLTEDEAVLLGYLVANGVRTHADEDHHIHDTAVRQRLVDEHGLAPANAAGTHIPHAVRTGGPKIQRAFLSALYEGDGWIQAGPEVGLTTTSRTLAEQVQLLLYGLGVPASLRTRRGGDLEREHHSVLVASGAVRRFLDQVGFRSRRRAEQVERHLTAPPADGSALRREHRHDLASRPLTYERIVSVTPAGDRPTFDVVVPDTHSFLANGVLSHNTTVGLHVVAEAQKLGGIAAFIDAEHALDPSYAKALGVDINELLVSQPDTGEQALEIADMLIRSSAVDIIVVDSVAALTPRAEIEGEMGDSHVGLQARLMSQALRKLAGSLSKSKTCAVFINQLREKVGVMFGCMTWDTPITLADGSQEPIGRIVDQRLPVEVLSYDTERDEFVPRKVVNWFDNGATDEFLHVLVADPGSGRGHSGFACTPNHLISTPHGWVHAGDLAVGDQVLRPVEHRLSPFQWDVVLGALLGDGALSPTRDGLAARFRYGHGAEQAGYADWKASLFANLTVSRTTGDDGTVSFDVEPLVELAELGRALHLGGNKTLGWDYLKRLTPLAIALWYQDAGTFALQSEGLQDTTRDGSGRSEICVQALERTSRERLRRHLADTWGLHAELVTTGGNAYLRFPTAETTKLHELIAPYVHPSMEHKLLPRLRGCFDVEPAVEPVRRVAAPMPVTSIEAKPPQDGHNHRFDLEVEGSHSYLAGGVVVHNSPETTPGGRALKFYSSVRLDVRRIETLKDGTDAVGNRVRVKVVKNKCVAAGTRVFDAASGLTRPIEELAAAGEGATVWATDKRGILHLRPVVRWMDQGEQDTIGLALRDGTEIVVTPDHRILTEHGWREAGELEVGDRMARPRRVGGFGEREPIAPHDARMLGGDPHLRRIPAALLAPDVSAAVLGNLLFGIWESDGWISRARTGDVHVGFRTTSEQLAWQLHWTLLRWGVASAVRAKQPGSHHGLVTGRTVEAELPRWEVEVTGSDNVARFADAVPMSGPKGEELTAALADPELDRHGGSPTMDLPETESAPVVRYLEASGLRPADVAAMVGDSAGDPDGGFHQVLGSPRLRRDRVERLAEALDSDFLRDVLAEELYFDQIVAIEDRGRRPTYDLEVDELHNFVADGIVVHNCAPPFRQAEFDILYGEGISKEGALIDVGVEEGIIRKAGAWYTYDGEQLGQGKENSRQFLKEHADVALEIEKKVKEKLGVDPLAAEDGADDPDVEVDLTETDATADKD